MKKLPNDLKLMKREQKLEQKIEQEKAAEASLVVEQIERAAALGERALPGTSQILPPGLHPRERKKLEAEARFTSIRAYRRVLDQAIAWAILGKISTRSALEVAQTIRVASELMMSEQIMAASGRLDIEPEHIDGQDGGMPYLPKEAPDHIETVVERRTGIGPKGEPIDETRIVAKGGSKLAKGTALLGPPIDTSDGSTPPLPSAFSEDD